MDWSKGRIVGFDPHKGETKVISMDEATKSASCTSSYVPKWLYRGAGLTFGFGGRLVTFNNNETSSLKLHQVSSSSQIIDDVKEFDQET